MIEISIYLCEGEWYAARKVDGEYDGCDALGITDEVSEAEAIAVAMAEPLLIAGERVVRRVPAPTGGR